MRTIHLRAAVAALLVAALALVGVRFYAGWLEQRYAGALAPMIFNQKVQGAALQRVAFQQPNMLPIYGASELIVARPYQYQYRASALFQKAPTGFRVFPVARRAAGSLILLQKLAAVGADMRDKKVVVIVSPTSFFNHPMDLPEAYAGNFSRLQANELAFGGDLSLGLRQAAARRMLAYPATLKPDPLLNFALRQLANGSPAGRALYYAVLPLGKLHTLALELQDHWQMLSFIWQHARLKPAAPRASQAIDWAATLDRATAVVEQHSQNNAFGFDDDIWRSKLSAIAPNARNSRSDANFRASLDRSKEWVDLKLLLRALQELGARPLILSAPIDGPYYDYLGVSREARAAYYQKLRDTVRPFGMPLRDFADHDADTTFLIDPSGHPSAVGWTYYDRAIDDFYHDRLQ